MRRSHQGPQDGLPQALAQGLCHEQRGLQAGEEGLLQQGLQAGEEGPKGSVTSNEACELVRRDFSSAEKAEEKHTQQEQQEQEQGAACCAEAEERWLQAAVGACREVKGIVAVKGWTRDWDAGHVTGMLGTLTCALLDCVSYDLVERARTSLQQHRSDAVCSTAGGMEGWDRLPT